MIFCILIPFYLNCLQVYGLWRKPQISKPRVSWLLDKLRTESFFENGGFLPYHIVWDKWIIFSLTLTLTLPFFHWEVQDVVMLNLATLTLPFFLRKNFRRHDILLFNPFLFQLSPSLWVMEETPNFQTKGELTFGQTENGKLFWKWWFPPIPYLLRQMNYILCNPNPNPTLFSKRSSGCTDFLSCNPNPTLFFCAKLQDVMIFSILTPFYLNCL